MASSSPTASIATRYAQSLHDLAAEAGKVDAIESALNAFAGMIDESDDLKRLIDSPVFSADEQSAAMSAILEKAGLEPLAANFLNVVAANRRLFALPSMIAAFGEIAARERGEITAEVTSATKLNATQEKQLKATLKDVVGKDVALNVTVDPSILGGLIVKVGSRQIDTSLKTRLSSLKLALKEVG
ncbi:MULTISPECIES: F0F1 ATP synthase subunit delta [unclassified Roseitalea]|uniref:F0F1 ATP synthase subunit delta n=1 Tax=unclassified Roseitalea TaxID=2639107 RepID=UPI00273D9517|nr:MULTISPECIES: F0F1 ATP synthase subunit delta [unclassified Roseitalea]